MESGSLLLSIFSILISFAAVIIAIKERKSGLRLVIYEKQLEASQMILQKVLQLEDALNDIQDDNRLQLDSSDSIKNAKKKEIELFDCMEFYSLFLPDKVFILTRKIQKILNFELKQMRSNKSYKMNSDRIQDLTLEYEDNVRVFYGIEKLTRVNEQVI